MNKLDMLHRMLPLLGILVMTAICVALSKNRSKINWTTVLYGNLLTVSLAIIILLTPVAAPFFNLFNELFLGVGTMGKEGARFLVGDQVDSTFLWKVLPTIIVYGAVMAVLYHIGLMKWIIYSIAWVMQRTMGISAVEAMASAANVFIGQSEAPLVIKPFLNKQTDSELMTLMTGGFATVAGGVMAAVVSILAEKIPDIAGHLLAASILSAPAAIVYAKILFPESAIPETSSLADARNALENAPGAKHHNFLDAATTGAKDATQMTIIIAGMLIAFVGGMWGLNQVWGICVNYSSDVFAFDASGFDSLQEVCAYVMLPFAYLMGIPSVDAFDASKLLAQKTLLNEFIAYKNLADGSGPVVGHTFQVRTEIILSYALCGFANFASIGIQLGGISVLAPELRPRLTRLAWLALLAGTFACFQTACLASLFL